MWQRHFYFLVVWILTFYGEINGQENSLKGEIITGRLTKSEINSSLPYLVGNSRIFQLRFLSKTPEFKANSFRGDLTNRSFLLKPGNITSAPRGYKEVESIGRGLAWRPLFKNDEILKITTLSPYLDHLGFFCKKEIQLDRFTPLPVRFRLGSLEYVNWLEQKPNARQF